MPGAGRQLFGVGSFVKAGIVEDQHHAGWPLRQQVAGEPQVENVGIDIRCGQPGAEQRPGQKRTDDIDPAPRVPVAQARAALAACGIAAGSWHVMGKAALNDVDDGPPGRFMRRDPRPEGLPCGGVRLRMRQGVVGNLIHWIKFCPPHFYMSHPICAVPARSPWA